MKINLYILTFIMLTSVVVNSQSIKKEISRVPLSGNIRELKIGDQMPEFLIQNIINETYKSIHTSAFKDQLLILDFWFTNCTGCVASLPKVMALQKEFGARIKILPVTYEKAALVSDFLKSNRNTKELDVPTVVEDQILATLFKHKYDPHEVWIYKGKVIAITEADYVTAGNITKILNGETNDWPLKDDFLPSIDIKTPLIIQNKSTFTGDFITGRYAAIFGTYQNGESSTMGVVIDSTNNTRRDYIINLPVLRAYLVKWNIFSDKKRYPGNTSILLEVKDSSKYVRQEDSKQYNFITKKKTYISFESVRPDSGLTEKQVAGEIISDLDRLLGLRGRYETREMKCLFLIRTDSVDRLKSKGKDKEGSLLMQTPHIEINNRELGSLVWKMNQFYGNPPVFDETDYKSNVDIHLELDSWQDLPALKKALKPYGLDLDERLKRIEVFVLSEN